MMIELNITDETMGFVFENIMNQDDVDDVKEAILKKLTTHNEINLYLEEDQLDTIKMGAFLDQMFFDIENADKIKKVAIVSDRQWIHGIAQLKNILTASEVRAFEQSERLDSLRWIMMC